MSAAPAAERFHGLDALRAAAMVLGVILHASIAYIPRVERSGWVVYDVSRSLLFFVLSAVIHNFRLDLFFVIAGFFAHAAWQRMGARAFLRDRALHILLPLLLGTLTLLPLIWAAVAQAGPRLGRVSAPLGVSVSYAHLWFLWLLCWLYPLVLVARRVTLAATGAPGRAAADRLLRGTLASYAGVLLLALPQSLAMLNVDHHLVWSGIHATDRLAVPHLDAMVSYGTAFVFGWLLHRQHGLLGRLARRWPGYLGAALACLLSCAFLSGVPVREGAPQPLWLGWATSLAYGGAAWAAILAMLGGFTRFCSQARPWPRYLADASYWMYLSHLPVVLWTEMAIMQAPVNCYLKFALVLAIALAIPLLTYHYWVRSTWLGELLNGRRYARASLRESLTRPAVPFVSRLS
jgi:peptidoglycan/LPS O-acetylase OafA/YrhL